MLGLCQDQYTLRYYSFLKNLRGRVLFLEKHINHNILCLRIVCLASYGYLFAIGVMVDYVSQITQRGTETLFYLESLSTLIYVCACLFIGLASDLSSRKIVLRAGMAMRCLGWCIMAFSPSYFILLIAFIIEAISSIMSKTTHCLYETLENTSREREYPKQEQILAIIPQFILIFGLPLAGFLYENVDIRIPIYMNVVLAFAGFLSTFLYTEPPRTKIEGEPPLIALKKILLFIKNTHRLRWFILFASLFESFVVMAILVYQAHFITISSNLALFSALMVLVYGIRAIGAYCSVYLVRLLGKYNAVWVTLLVSCALLVFSGFSNNIIIFTAFMLLYMFLRGLFQPLINSQMNSLLTSDRRATAFSTMSTIGGLFFVLVNFLIGIGIEELGTGMTMVWAGIGLATGCGAFLYAYQQADIAHEKSVARD